MKSNIRLVVSVRGLVALLLMLAANAGAAPTLQAATFNVVSCDASELISAITSRIVTAQGIRSTSPLDARTCSPQR
jgi:hypothetical protein